MQLANSLGRYGAFPQAFHWLTLVCVVGAWPLGWFIDDFPKSAEGAVLLIHMTLGECVIALLVARFVWRFVELAATLGGDPLEVAQPVSSACKPLHPLCAAPVGAGCRDHGAAQARAFLAGVRDHLIRVSVAGRSRDGADGARRA